MLPTELKRFRAGSAPDRFEAQGDSVVAAKVESVASRVPWWPVRQTPIPTLQALAWRALPDNVTVPAIVNWDVLSRSRETLIPNRPPAIDITPGKEWEGAGWDAGLPAQYPFMYSNRALNRPDLQLYHTAFSEDPRYTYDGGPQFTLADRTLGEVEDTDAIVNAFWEPEDDE